MTPKYKSSDSDAAKFNMPERSLKHFLKVKRVCMYGEENIIYIKLGIIHPIVSSIHWGGVLEHAP